MEVNYRTVIMESKKAKQYCQVHNLHKNFDDTYFGETIIIVDMAEKEMKEKAIEAFTEFIENYCKESGRTDISNDSEHYIKVFTNLLNK